MLLPVVCLDGTGVGTRGGDACGGFGTAGRECEGV